MISDSSTGDGIEYPDKFWENATDEDIVDATAFAIGNMRFYDLSRLQNIELIELLIEREENLSRILTPRYKNLDCRCHRLRLGVRYGSEDFVTNLGDLLYHFDAEIVECHGAGTLVPDHFIEGRTLSEIRLSNMEEIPLYKLLQTFTQIEILACEDSCVCWNSRQPVVHSKLKALTFDCEWDAKDLGWLKYLCCSVLEKLDAPWPATHKSFTTFLAHVPSIRRLNLAQYMNEENISGLVRYPSRVESLVLPGSSIDLVYN